MATHGAAVYELAKVLRALSIYSLSSLVASDRVTVCNSLSYVSRKIHKNKVAAEQMWPIDYY